MSDKAEKQAISEDERAAMCAIHKFKRNCTDECEACKYRLHGESFVYGGDDDIVTGTFYPMEKYLHEMHRKTEIELVKMAMEIIKIWCESQKKCKGCPFELSCMAPEYPREWSIEDEGKTE